jgi:GNAT superfamily N-acetyltransferase
LVVVEDGGVSDDFTISAGNPESPAAAAMAHSLWEEIQACYGFTAADPFDPTSFRGPIGGFWVATPASSDDPVGSIALTPHSDGVAELDVMYVELAHRRRGIAQQLLAVLEDHARENGISVVRLRAGDPQPEAMRFYAAAGFKPIPAFGRWIGDESARCLEKVLPANRQA